MKNTILLILFISGTANAQWNKISATEFEVGPPPEVNSNEYKADFDLLLTYQQSRTTAQCKLAEQQKWPSYKSFFGYSKLLTKSEYAKAEPLIKKVMSFTLTVSTAIKKVYNRERPYDLDDRIEPCVEKPGGSMAYPSSHAALAAAASCVLAEIFPQKAEKILEYGESLGELRIVVGVHHPSDVKAGQQLAYAICERLKSEKDFQKELETIR